MNRLFGGHREPIGQGLDASERERFEREVVDRTRTSIERALPAQSERDELLDVTLDGKYPDTQIVITLRDSRQGGQPRIDTQRYWIWRSRGAGIEYPSADQAGRLFATWALGG